MVMSTNFCFILFYFGKYQFLAQIIDKINEHYFNNSIIETTL